MYAKKELNPAYNVDLEKLYLKVNCRVLYLMITKESFKDNLFESELDK